MVDILARDIILIVYTFWLIITGILVFFMLHRIRLHIGKV